VRGVIFEELVDGRHLASVYFRLLSEESALAFPFSLAVRMTYYKSILRTLSG
jgi:hypothetical protein